GSVDGERTGHPLPIIRDWPGGQGGENGGDYDPTRRTLDAANRAQPDGLRKRRAALEALPDHRPRQQVYGAVSAADPTPRSERNSSARVVPEFECILGTLRGLDPARVSEPNDLHWSGIVAPRGSRMP